MLRIEVWTSPGCTIPEYDYEESPTTETRRFIRKGLGPFLPRFFVTAGESLGMGPNTSVSDVSVHFFDLGVDDIDLVQIRFKAYFNTRRPPKAERLFVRDDVRDTIVGAFRAFNLNMPKSFEVEVFWVKSNGRRTINGTLTEW